jgi:hypothetical protein
MDWLPGATPGPSPGDLETAKRYQQAISEGKDPAAAARFAMGMEEEPAPLPELQRYESPAAAGESAMGRFKGILGAVGQLGVGSELRQDLEQVKQQYGQEPVLAKQAMAAGGGTVAGAVGQMLPTMAAAGAEQQASQEQQALAGLPPKVPMAQAGAGAAPGQPGSPGSRVSISGSGPIGDIGKLGQQMAGLGQEQREHAQGALAPYTPPEGVAGSRPGLEGASAALDRAATLDELRTLEGKPEKSLAELGRMGELATQLAAGTQQEKAQKEAQAKAAGEQQLQKLAQQQAHQEVLRKNRVNEETEKLRQSIEDVKDWQLEPTRLWTENWGKALSAIAIGALGQTWQQQHGQPGAQNAGLRGMMQAVDRDIEAQKMEYGKRKGLAGEQRGVLADMMARFKDENVAEHAARISLMQSVDRQLASVQDRYKGTEIGDQARIQRTALQTQTADRVRQFQAAVDANTMQSLQAQAGVAGTRAQLGMQAEHLAMAKEAKAQAGYGKPLSEKQISEIEGLKNALRQVADVEGEFKKHKQENPLEAGFPNVLSPAGRKWNDLRESSANAIGAALEGGKIGRGAFPRYVDMMPGAGDSDARGQAKINHLRAQVFSELRGKIKALAQTGYGLPADWLQLVGQQEV